MFTKALTKRLFFPAPEPPSPSISAGLYHYMNDADGAHTRFHLRVEPDGRGLLIANASAAARLNQTGVIIAKGILDKDSDEDILQTLKKHFRGGSNELMQNDLELVSSFIANLSSPDDNYPIINLEDAELSPFEVQLIAPLQADIPLAQPEELLPILDLLWKANVPHVTILAPEEPNHEHLIRLIERAEDLGMIAGVRGRATDLNDPQLNQDLAQAGIDHLNILIASSEASVHDTIFGDGDLDRVLSLFKNSQQLEIAPVAEMPLVSDTLDQIEQVLETLMDVGVRNVNFLAIAAPGEMSPDERAGALAASAMPQIADLVEEMANDSDVRFIWQPPVLRNPKFTLSEQIRRGPRCSDDLSVRVEPNGDVIPARGPYLPAGNLLRDKWVDIWSQEVFVHYRERVERPTHCDECPGLAICAADCPRNLAGWSQGVGGDS